MAVQEQAGQPAELTIQQDRAAGQDGIQVGVAERGSFLSAPEVVVDDQFVPPESDRLVVRNIVSGGMKQGA